MKDVFELLTRLFTSVALGLTLFSGLLTIMLERFLYAKRGYKKEARITAVIGWTYVGGGTLLFITLRVMSGWM